MDSHYSTKTSVKLGDLNQDSVSPWALHRRCLRAEPALPGTGREACFWWVPADQGKMTTSASRFLSNHLRYPSSLQPGFRASSESRTARRDREEALSLNNLWSNQAWQRGKRGRDTHRGVFSHLFRVTKCVGGITRTKAEFSSVPVYWYVRKLPEHWSKSYKGNKEHV